MRLVKLHSAETHPRWHGKGIHRQTVASHAGWHPLPREVEHCHVTFSASAKTSGLGGSTVPPTDPTAQQKTHGDPTQHGVFFLTPPAPQAVCTKVCQPKRPQVRLEFHSTQHTLLSQDLTDGSNWSNFLQSVLGRIMELLKRTLVDIPDSP